MGQCMGKSKKERKEEKEEGEFDCRTCLSFECDHLSCLIFPKEDDALGKKNKTEKPPRITAAYFFHGQNCTWCRNTFVDIGILEDKKFDHARVQNHGGGDAHFEITGDIDMKPVDEMIRRHLGTEVTSPVRSPPITLTAMKILDIDKKSIDTIISIVVYSPGFLELKIDAEKNHVTIRGVMKMGCLTSQLQKYLGRNVVVVPPNVSGEAAAADSAETSNEGANRGPCGHSEGNYKDPVYNYMPYDESNCPLFYECLPP